jgi:hypothetical protein
MISETGEERGVFPIVDEGPRRMIES